MDIGGSSAFESVWDALSAVTGPSTIIVLPGKYVEDGYPQHVLVGVMTGAALQVDVQILGAGRSASDVTIAADSKSKFPSGSLFVAEGVTQTLWIENLRQLSEVNTQSGPSTVSMPCKVGPSTSTIASPKRTLQRAVCVSSQHDNAQRLRDQGSCLLRSRCQRGNNSIH